MHANSYRDLRRLAKTVAKVATLQQVAKIGEVPIGVLINTLRKEIWNRRKMEKGGPADKKGTDVPEWFATAKISMLLDAAPILEAGEHPLAQVMGDLAEFGAGGDFTGW